MTFTKPWFALMCVIGTATEAYAQGSITGLVRDTSGAVVPGVTVEASSTALIEKSRVVATDASGQYLIVDLRPGMYTVLFTLAGFKTVKRDGIELTGSFVATANAELNVGAVEETVTVTGRVPTVVDVQSTKRQWVLGRDVIDTVPTGRTDRNLAVLIPGISSTSATCAAGGPTCQDVGGVLADQIADLTIHGSRGADARQTQNGLSLNTLTQGGQNALAALPNLGAMEEVTVDSAGVSAEMATGGVRINFIPREGSNTFKGSLFVNGASRALQSSNFTQDLKDRGLAIPNAVNRNWDINPGFGGPLRRDALWFYATARYNGTWNYVGGMFYNLNANNPNAWSYAPDSSRQASNNTTWKDAQIRLTWQATRKNKIGVTSNHQERCSCPSGAFATISPEAGFDGKFPLGNALIAEWTSPITNRFLVDGGLLHRVEGFGNRVPTDLSPLMIAVTEQATGLNYRARALYTDTRSKSFSYRAAASFVTGTHAFKLGFNGGSGFVENSTHSVQPVSYRFFNGVPTSILFYATPYRTAIDQDADLGLYAQDKWTVGRLTLTLGARYDYFTNSTPQQSVGPGPLVPDRNLTFPATPGVAWHDVTPKTGASYDLFGNGTTALKLSLNKYLAGEGLTGTFGLGLSPVGRLLNSASRSWRDLNGNFVPDCDLANPSQHGECGPFSARNFGQSIPGVTYDPATLRGWGKRSYNWELSAGVQRELLPRVLLDVSYYRRWYGNFAVADNRSVGPADFSPYSITVPIDSRLPGGGGYVISGLHDVNPAKFGLVDNYVTFSDRYGRRISHWNGVDAVVSARPEPGVLLQGGLSTGSSVSDNCDVVTKVDNPSTLYCHFNSGFLTQVKLLGAYLIPRLEVRVSGAFQSLPGPPINAFYIATNALIAPSLGRNLSGGVANATVNLVQPGTMYGDRINQLDLRFGKVLKFGRARTVVNVDLYNALNVNPVLVENINYAVWRRPQVILIARFLKFGVQLDF